MEWIFSEDRPIYLQLEEQIKLRIVTGIYAPGSRLPTVRDLAEEAAVNPNTLQKALSELERQGLVHAQRTSGRFVTEDETMILEAKDGLAYDQIKGFLERMSALGYSVEDSVKLIESRAREEK